MGGTSVYSRVVASGGITVVSSSPFEWGRFDIDRLSLEREGDGMVWETAPSVEKGSRLEASGDPLDELGALINAMLDRITRLMEGMRDSLDNVARTRRSQCAIPEVASP